MFLHGQSYTRQLQEALASADDLRVAVAFWGAGAERYFHGRPSGASTRLICNLASGACNPRVIGLLQASGYELRTLDTLHAKVVITDHFVLTGSANISANGLSYEGETAQGWAEAGVKLADRQAYADAVDWFERLWLRSRPVTRSELDKIEMVWRQRRSNRKLDGDGLISEMRESELDGANVFFALYDQPPSEAADALFLDQQAQLPEEARDRLSYWEEWDELPHGATILSVHCGPRGSLDLEGAYVRLAGSGIPTSIGTTVQLVTEVAEVLGRRFSSRQRASLRQLCAPVLRQSWRSKPADQDGLLLPLDDVVRRARSTPEVP